MRHNRSTFSVQAGREVLQSRSSMKEDESIELPDGRRMGYAEYGDPEGRPVLYFHGWPSSRYQARHLDAPARELGLRVVAPDRPGIGLSDPKPGRHFGDWPADAAAFAERMGLGPLRIFGISGGGPYTLACCAALGDRIERAAVVCGAPPLVDGHEREHLHWVYRGLAGMPKFRRKALSALLPLSTWMIDRGPARAPMSWMMRSVGPADRDALRHHGGWEVITRSFLEAIRNGRDPVLEEGELYLEPWDFQPEDIHVPVRFWHGRADANLPCEVARKLSERVPGAVGTWVPDEGHYSLPIRHAREVLEWLAEPG